MIKVLLFLIMIINLLLANDWVKKDDIIIDQKNHLQWEKTSSIDETLNIWKMAKSYCESLQLAGSNNWRLPSKTELQDLANSQTDKVNFSNLGNHLYWSNDEDKDDELNAFVVYLPNGFTSKSDKCEKNYTVCVSNIK